MLAAAPAPFVPQKIYGLYNRTVVDSEIINTGVAPFADGVNCTILMDINITTNPSDTSNAYRYRLMYIVRSEGSGRALSVEKPSQWNANIRALIGNVTSNDNIAKIATSAAGRKRIIVTHVANTNSIHAYGKVGTGDLLEKTPTNTAVDFSSQNLTLGATGTGYGLPPATINKCEVYNYVFSQAEIDSFFADE